MALGADDAHNVVSEQLDVVGAERARAMGAQQGHERDGAAASVGGGPCATFDFLREHDGLRCCRALEVPVEWETGTACARSPARPRLRTARSGRSRSRT